MTVTRKRIGIIQSRGLGDIVIALPIAHYYHDHGYEVWWPVCEPFYEQMKRAAPWVRWLSVPVDEEDNYFYVSPHRRLLELGVTEELWLYQFLKTHPEHTNRSWFSQFKFDEYKYAVAGVPFGYKWRLMDCITRDPAAEEKLYSSVVQQPRFMVYQRRASDLAYDLDLGFIDAAVQRIEICGLTDSIWDWLKVLEGAEAMVLIDSVMANLVDQLSLNPAATKYFLRKHTRRVDENPVLLGHWSWVNVNMDINGQPFRSIE